MCKKLKMMSFNQLREYIKTETAVKDIRLENILDAKWWRLYSVMKAHKLHTLCISRKWLCQYRRGAVWVQPSLRQQVRLQSARPRNILDAQRRTKSSSHLNLILNLSPPSAKLHPILQKKNFVFILWNSDMKNIIMCLMITLLVCFSAVYLKWKNPTAKMISRLR